MIENMDLNINTLLINWSLMSGYLHGDIIKTTAFGRFNLWFGFVLSIFHGIKWSVLLFSSKDSQMANLLGEWAYYFGPKIILDLVIVFLSVFVISVKLLFVYASKHTKNMMYWLEAMKFDPVNRSFDKLNLTEYELKVFIKRLSLSLFLLKSAIYSISSFCVLVIFVLIFKIQNDHHLNYLISLLCFLTQLYLNISLMFGFIVILYPVSFNFKSLFNCNLISDLLLFRTKIPQFERQSKSPVELQTKCYNNFTKSLFVTQTA